jgi:hypothetical protein
VNDYLGGLALFEAGPKGLGVFATPGFRRGERILWFRGPLLPTGSIDDFTHAIQVDEGLFLGASGEIDDYVNHSCDPNCSLESAPPRLSLVAVRDIASGEEVTFDYSTCLLDESFFDGCGCASHRCRGRIVPFWELAPAWRSRYQRLDMVPEFVVRARPRSVVRRVADPVPTTASALRPRRSQP